MEVFNVSAITAKQPANNELRLSLRNQVRPRMYFIFSAALQYLWLPVARPPVSWLLNYTTFIPGQSSDLSALRALVQYFIIMELHSARQISQVKHLWSPQPVPAGWLAGGSVHRAHCVWPEKTGQGWRPAERERERERWCLVKHFRRPAPMWYSIKLFVAPCLLN